MKGLINIAAIAILVPVALIFTGGCGESTQEESLPPETESPVASPGLPPATESPEQPQSTEGWNPDGELGDNEYLGEMAYGDYEIRWVTDDQYAYFGIRVKTKGWVSIGFNPSSRMKDADMIFGAVAGGQVTISDQYSTGAFGPHSPDTELGGTNDIFEFSGREADGFTTIEFSRALNTGDTYDHEFSKGTVKIIWAYGSADDFGRQHIARGTGEISL